ncbi:MAG: hypothetical protein DI544_11730 [Sphingomonas taxi]|uniref:Putative restriction endonuclease domain-containing protein n=1 Tax=Sphingomonas taxi TaxID=1549858 RepID=A0A2W5QN69_9SPHN|nr:MAG: hypothetical protein DI544_11730 [Sphingomonas taxi]
MFRRRVTAVRQARHRRAGGARHRPFVCHATHATLSSCATIRAISPSSTLIGVATAMMTGGTPAHSRAASNIPIHLRSRPRGSGCRAYNSGTGVRLADDSLRYPDASVVRQPCQCRARGTTRRHRSACDLRGAVRLCRQVR